MANMKRVGLILGLWLAGTSIAQASDLRVGLVGLDTSHAVAFTRILNDPSDANHVAGARVVAAFKGGSPDLDASRNRIEGFTAELTEKYGIELFPTIEDLCRNVDAVMLLSVDGRAHLAQAIPIVLARKPFFIDKPMAASLRDAIAIFQLAARYDVPVFSSSGLRYGVNTQAVRAGSIGRVHHAETTSPSTIDPTHPDLFWYGIHGVESLFTVMGTGCETVRRGTTADGAIEVTGVWRGGRTGVFREDRAYGGLARGEDGETAVGSFDGYAPMVAEILRFFRTGETPIPQRETIELFAFMEAADESKRRGGEPVSIAEILDYYGHPGLRSE
jgi:hypothetical protein